MSPARSEVSPLFQIDKLKLAAANKLFSPMAVENLPTAIGDRRTGVQIDAGSDPGVELLATLRPALNVTGGVRRIAATQIVTASVSIPFDKLLPIFWLASVLRSGDIAPNLMSQPYSDISDDFQLNFGEELVVTHEGGVWQLPHYDDEDYSVNVGFGIGRSMIAWAYSVLCQPGEPVALAPDSYQLVRSDGLGGIGDPVPDGLEEWTMPLGFQYSLTFDEEGNGILSRIQTPRSQRLGLFAGGGPAGKTKPGRGGSGALSD